ncbi:MAG: BrnT family toxin [Rhodospirillales bacterium]|nr:BrnT family toxin [Rhodospirillales bacterium]
MYEWDESKRAANRKKHGVDFSEADRFDWETALVAEDDSHDERRYIAIGFIGGVLHVMVFTERGEQVRIISLRKATRRERRIYHDG